MSLTPSGDTYGRRSRLRLGVFPRALVTVSQYMTAITPMTVTVPTPPVLPVAALLRRGTCDNCQEMRGDQHRHRRLCRGVESSPCC
jgi:hypothetical protein